jgi:hypothetical protein
LGATLHCYPVDDTVAVTVAKAEGFDGFPRLLKRCRLPRDSTAVPGNDFFVGQQAKHV